jgi:hypothetical protein
MCSLARLRADSMTRAKQASRNIATSVLVGFIADRLQAASTQRLM